MHTFITIVVLWGSIGISKEDNPYVLSLADPIAVRAARFAVRELPHRYEDFAFCAQRFTLHRLLSVVARRSPAATGAVNPMLEYIQQDSVMVGYN